MEFKSQFIDSSHKILTDEATLDITYIGEAAIGSDEASPVWAIRKVETTADWLIATFAEWNSHFDKIWNDRLTYTYS